MADLVFLAITVGFFALMVLLVRACDHVIGPDGADLGGASGEPSTSADRAEMPS